MTVPSLKCANTTFIEQNDEIVKYLIEHYGSNLDLVPYDEARKDKVEIYLNHFYTKQDYI